MISLRRESKYRLALLAISAVGVCWLGGCGGSQASGISKEEAAQINHEPRPGGPPPEAQAAMEQSNNGAPAGVAGAPADAAGAPADADSAPAGDAPAGADSAPAEQ